MLDFSELVARCAAVQGDILPEADAYPYALVTSGTYPHFTNRLDTFAVEGDSEDFDVHTVTVEMLLLHGHMTEGSPGALEAVAYRRVDTVVRGFNQRELLQSSGYPDAMTDLIRARITSVRPLVVLENSGVGARQIASVFTLTCELTTAIEDEY